ncbi:MAG: sulfatase [Verrucomicrobiota bacterium]
MIRGPFAFLSVALLAYSSLAGDRLNVLLITADDLGLQLSCYGDPYIETPKLDALASSGVQFRTAYVTHASCSSSRSSMLSGLYPHTTGQIGLANAGFVLAEEEIGKNLMVYLKEAGYRNGILGKLHIAPESSFPLDFRPKKQDTRDVRAVAANAARFLNEESDKPFFLMVNYSDPHFARDRETQKPVFPSQWKGLPPDPISEDTIPGWDFQGFDEPVARKRASNYYNTVKRLDIGVGLLLDELDQSGHRGNTLVIYLSDHGPPFSRGKTTCYESGLRVPFLVRWPGVSTAGIESKALVSTVDIVPTILDAAGVEFPREFHGESLRPILTNAEPPTSWRTTLVGEFHFHGYQPYFPRRAIRDQRFKLIHNPLAGSSNPPVRVDGDPIVPYAEKAPHRDTPAGAAFRVYADPPEWEFYDLETDPVEFQNLIDDPAHAERIVTLKSALRSWQEDTDDPITTPQGIERMREIGLAAKERDEAATR